MCRRRPARIEQRPSVQLDSSSSLSLGLARRAAELGQQRPAGPCLRLCSRCLPAADCVPHTSSRLRTGLSARRPPHCATCRPLSHSRRPEARRPLSHFPASECLPAGVSREISALRSRDKWRKWRGGRTSDTDSLWSVGPHLLCPELAHPKAANSAQFCPLERNQLIRPQVDLSARPTAIA